MTKQLVLSALAVATLALNACSSEPSDWRADKKVSVDMVEPGTRSSDNFDQHSAEGAHEAGGAAAGHTSAAGTHDEAHSDKTVTAEENRSVDATDAAQTNSPEAVESVRKTTTAPQTNSTTTGATNEATTANNTTDVKK